MESLLANYLSHPVRVNPQAAISFAYLACSISLIDLQAELKYLLQRSWIDHVNRQDYRGSWDVLPLRCQRRHANAHPILQGFSITGEDEWQDLPQLDSCPAIRHLLSHLQCPLKAVRLMRLKAGAEIKPHRDKALSIEFGQARLHVPIQASDEILFLVNRKPVPMRTGELWYINADQEHAVYNRGAEDRINLVIDCVANEWLCEKIMAGYRPKQNDDGNH